MERARGMISCPRGGSRCSCPRLPCQGIHWAVGGQAIRHCSPPLSHLTCSLMRPHCAPMMGRPRQPALPKTYWPTDLLCMMMRPPAELWDGQTERAERSRVGWVEGFVGPDRLACFDASGRDDGRGYTLASTSPIAGNGRTGDGRTTGEREGDDHQEAIRREESI